MNEERKRKSLFVIGYSFLLFLLIYGSLQTGTERLFDNTVVMPLAGVIAYVLFHFHSLYLFPLMLLASNLFVIFFNDSVDIFSALMFDGLYCLYALAGAAAAFLTTLTFRKAVEGEKKWLRIVYGGIAVFLVVSVGCSANAFVGNPVSYFLAKNTVEHYLEEKYGKTDYEVESLGYSFKFGEYYAHITSPTLLDGDFSLTVNMTGKVKSDDYTDRVEEKSNVERRLSMAYRERVEEILETPSFFPYQTEIAFGDLEFEREEGEEFPEGALERADLENNRLYDLKELGQYNGTITLYVDSDTVTEEKATEVLLTLKKQLNDGGISFYRVDVILQEPRSEKDPSKNRKELHLREFLCEDIEESIIEEKVAENRKATEAYYAEQDKQK